MSESNYQIHVTLVNETEGHVFSEWDEPIDVWDLRDDGTPDFGVIYRTAQREWGRCQSSVFVDRTDGPPRRVGWFFVKRDQYDRGKGSYLLGAWVTVVKVVVPTVGERTELVEVAS